MQQRLSTFFKKAVLYKYDNETGRMIRQVVGYSVATGFFGSGLMLLLAKSYVLPDREAAAQVAVVICFLTSAIAFAAQGGTDIYHHYKKNEQGNVDEAATFIPEKNANDLEEGRLKEEDEATLDHAL